MTRFNIMRFAALFVLASLAACKTTQPPAPVAVVPKPAVVYVPEPVVVAAPIPAPAPVYVEPDYTTLPGHSSVTTPVPVEPVDVQEMGPVIGQ